MPVEANGRPGPQTGGASIKVAAAGDMHCRESNREQTAKAFAEVDGTVDLILLAGDLTTHGQPEQAQVLADACRGPRTPVFTVLGNHDWQCDQRDELVAVLEDAAVTRARPRPRDLPPARHRGRDRRHEGLHGRLPRLAPLELRRAVDARALQGGHAGGRGLERGPAGGRALPRADRRCSTTRRPSETLRGEPEGIWTFLGTDRLAPPIVEAEPDLVLHGHAHAGTFEGRVGDVPVFNVSVPVMRRDFWVFELTAAERKSSAIH